MAKDLLVEIGVEELPASYLKPALVSLVKYISGSLKTKKLPYSAVRTFSTPRRLAVQISQIPEKQEDERIEKVGPAKRIAYDSEGNLTKAGEGFVRSSGIKKEDLSIKTTPKGDYISAKIFIKGEETGEILRLLLPEAINKISFPRTMHWASKNLMFARPIRWLLALYDEEVIEFEMNGLNADRLTFGNVLEKKPEQITLRVIDDYQRELEKSLVISNREKRKQLIEQQPKHLPETVNATTKNDEELLEEVTDIVEYPTAVLAKFHDSYLKLPERIIHSTLAKNQKYFALYSKENCGSKCEEQTDSPNRTESQLLNHFIFVSNNHPGYSENTRPGNERVVKARLDDADFYYQEDLQKSIDFFNSRLTKMIFHASLGTIMDKVGRTVKISAYLAEVVGMDKESRQRLNRAASICKFDLATNMIAEKEFTGLQGYIGKIYALEFGEEPEVARAIEEHYHPISFKGILPESILGTVISLSDKIDTLCSIFALGEIPTGSNDPYALRRAGNGVIKILYDKEIPADIAALVNFTYDLLKNEDARSTRQVDTGTDDNRTKVIHDNQKELMNFLQQRIEWVLGQNGIDYDIINSVMLSGFTKVDELKKKVEALQKLRKRSDFEQLILSYKRVANILSASQASLPGQNKVNSSLLQEEAERDLYRILLEAEKKRDELLAKSDFQSLLEEFIQMKEEIDRFFDDVLVNVKDEGLRNNRYALLSRIKELFLSVGDLSHIVLEGQGK